MRTSQIDTLLCKDSLCKNVVLFGKLMPLKFCNLYLVNIFSYDFKNVAIGRSTDLDPWLNMPLSWRHLCVNQRIWVCVPVNGNVYPEKMFNKHGLWSLETLICQYIYIYILMFPVDSKINFLVLWMMARLSLPAFQTGVLPLYIKLHSHCFYLGIMNLKYKRLSVALNSVSQILLICMFCVTLEKILACQPILSNCGFGFCLIVMECIICRCGQFVNYHETAVSL